MKIFLRTLLTFLFILVFQFVLKTDCSVSNNVQDFYVQKNRTDVVLISENLRSSEISLQEENNDSYFTICRTFFVKSNVFSNINLLNKSEKIASANIHNLSTNYQKSKFIRAP